MINPILEKIEQAIKSIVNDANFYVTTTNYYEKPIDCIIWSETNKSKKPSWSEIEKSLGKDIDLINNFFLEPIKERKIAECKSYLDRTEWYVNRLNDPSSGKQMPQNVLTNRANARAWQDSIKNCQTLKELEKININFE